MSKKNYTFSLSKDIISISKERAKEERRSLSSLVEVALESYVNGARASKAYNPETSRPIEESNEQGEQTYCQHSWETSKFYPGEYFCSKCHEYKGDLY